MQRLYCRDEPGSSGAVRRLVFTRECKLGGEQEKTSGRQCRPSLQVHMSCCRLIFTQNQRGNHCKVLSKGMTTLPAGSLYHPTVQNSYESFHLLNPPTQLSCPTLTSYEIHPVPQARNEIEIYFLLI